MLFSELFVVLIIFLIVFNIWWVCFVVLFICIILFCLLKVKVLDMYIMLLVRVLGEKGVRGVLLFGGVIMVLGIICFSYLSVGGGNKMYLLC